MRVLALIVALAGPVMAADAPAPEAAAPPLTYQFVPSQKTSTLSPGSIVSATQLILPSAEAGTVAPATL